MKKLSIMFTFLFLFVIGIFTVHPTTAQAANLNYTVSVDHPDNQVSSNISYFDLKVKPDDHQKLTIHIDNTDSTAHKYLISINRANTNSNGVIDYSKHGTKADSSLESDIEKMVPQPKTVTVPANTNQAESFELNVPKNEFKGIVLGGIQVKSLDSNKQPVNKKGVTLNNQYAYVIGLQLQESSASIKPNINLNYVKSKQINYQNYIVANLQNDQPTLINKIDANARITKQGGEIAVYKLAKPGLDMAPNSNFDLPVSTNNKPLKAGKYTLHLKLSTSTKTWNFTKNFTISSTKAKQMNKTAVGETKSNNNWLMLTLIGILILIIIALMFVIIKNKNKNKK
ncbi:DUF916 and DUF3324 domain-containing protein [Companilactobacillus baiquanensis]|uniref:DUF916 and DUF3324 domain-containing protein n=1 Tax=Companilactobacillus baiquanensis TaxID=2486005 RepID=A0ABW1UXV3_9LACO|nr:DUF916 and DUF3324 domain-containing protein [Companilactobacillus baiquanensis]